MNDITNRDTFQQLRTEYSDKPLTEEDVAADPFEQFQTWFSQACDAGVYEPNAMVVSTVDAAGAPDSRVVLFKGLFEQQLTFFTNYTSAKGKQIAAHSSVALLFYWPELHRQVRISGAAAQLPAAQSDAYFQLRPRGAQIGAHASLQSTALATRAELEDAIAVIEKQFTDIEVPRPTHWGGYGVSPLSFEFWQGRRSRLHDRICYTQQEGQWIQSRLSP